MTPKFTDAGVTWAVLTVMVGFLLCVAGYRLLRFSACAIAFITGATLIVDQVLLGLFSIAAALFYWPLYLLFGCLFGFFGSLSTSANVLVISFCGGANFAQLCLALLEFHGSIGLSFVITVVSSVIMVVAVKFETKPALVASTSFLGALTMASGMGYLMRAALTSSTPSETPFKEIASWTNFVGCLLWGPNVFFKGETQMQITSWTVFAILMVLVACGGLLQWKLTGRGNHHEASSSESLSSEETQQHGGNNGESVNAGTALRYESLQSPQEVKRSVYQQTCEEDKEHYYVVGGSDPVCHV